MNFMSPSHVLEMAQILLGVFRTGILKTQNQHRQRRIGVTNSLNGRKLRGLCERFLAPADHRALVLAIATSVWRCSFRDSGKSLLRAGTLATPHSTLSFPLRVGDRSSHSGASYQPEWGHQPCVLRFIESIHI